MCSIDFHACTTVNSVGVGFLFISYSLIHTHTHTFSPSYNSVHYHCDALNAVFHGHKVAQPFHPIAFVPFICSIVSQGLFFPFFSSCVQRWFLLPPGRSIFSRQPALDLVRSSNMSECMQCSQYPGELLYVPKMYAHATLNVGETVAVAKEVGECQSFGGYIQFA